MRKMTDKTEKLIEMVKCYPVLYDTSHADYKNNRIRNRIWDNIAELLDEKDGDVVKNKWKNLKDCYSKHIRSLYGQPPKYLERYKTWPWVNHISFLQPFLEVTYTNGSDLEKPSVSLASAPTQEHAVPHMRRRPRATRVAKVIDYLIDRDNKHRSEYDANDLIFLGYARSIKHMTVQRQAQLKYKIAKIVMEAEIEQAEECERALPSAVPSQSYEHGSAYSEPQCTFNEPIVSVRVARD